MKSWMLGAEAEECRQLAVELADRPEESFLLGLASAFDDLYVQRAATTADVREGENGADAA